MALNGVGGPTAPLTATRPGAQVSSGLPADVAREAAAGLGSQGSKDSCIVSGKAHASGMNLDGPAGSDQPMAICQDVVAGYGGGFGGF